MMANKASQPTASNDQQTTENYSRMDQRTLKRKKAPENQVFKLVIPRRPDLDRFKPDNGNIFDDCPNRSDDLDKPIEILDSPKSSSSSKSKSNHPSPIAVVEAKPRKSLPKSSKPPRKSKPVKKPRARSTKDESPDPDEDDDIDDIALSDYSEPETKLREREPTERRKYAKLRKARNQLNKKKSINKEVNSKRIVPDSDIEIEGVPGNSKTQLDGSDDEDSEDDSSGSDSDDDSSETDEEERKRKEKEFIVDDLQTQAQVKRAQKRIETFMPVMFKNTKLDNRSHFKVVCEYLVYHIILPQIEWRKVKEEFDQSCKHLDDFFDSHGVQALDSSGWTQIFRNELISRPYITERPCSSAILGCAACRNRTKYSKKVLNLTGRPYCPTTLKPLKPKKVLRDSSSQVDSEEEEDESSGIDEEDEGKQHKYKLNPELMQITPTGATLASGDDCARRSIEYHYFKHWKIYLIKQLRLILKPHREKHEILQEVYRHFDPAPKPDRLRLMEREIRKTFQTIQADQNHTSLDSLYNHFNNRLNKVKKTYAS